MAKQIVKPYELYSKICDHPKSEFVSFLDRLSNLYGLKTSSIFDLACGTGSLIRELIDSEKVERAVGLDISREMLHVAKQKFHEADNVKLVQGDFRAFSLGEKFDTILCIYDSLNYVNLTLVNRNVASLSMSWICQSTTSDRGAAPAGLVNPAALLSKHI